eukprot:scaffold130410_cov24-Phaeocystis_antarctica.AAC.1
MPGPSYRAELPAATLGLRGFARARPPRPQRGALSPRCVTLTTPGLSCRGGAQLPPSPPPPSPPP